MTTEPHPENSDESPAEPPKPYHQELQHSQVSARVPEDVGHGVFSTGAIVMHGVHEFVIDFLMSMTAPRRIAARVVLPPSVVPLLVGALQENLKKYQDHFGSVPKFPAPVNPQNPGTPAPAPPISEVYEQLKLPDEMLSGVYANTVMIVHTPAEFCFDFITSFYPRSAVSCRVYLAAPHVPQLLDSLNHSLDQYRRRTQQTRPPEPPAS